MSEPVEMRARIMGFVQGVGFRFTTLSYAENLGLAGTVQNLPDGSVEIYAQGTKAALEKLIQLLKSQSGGARIDHLELQFYQPVKTFSGFHVIR